MYLGHPIVADIHNTILELHHCSKQINVCWIPSHVGIQRRKKNANYMFQNLVRRAKFYSHRNYLHTNLSV